MSEVQAERIIGLLKDIRFGILWVAIMIFAIAVLTGVQ